MAELLKMIMHEGVHTKQQIAEKLGVEIEALDHMIELLLRKGLLRSSECDVVDTSHCSRCPVEPSCGKPAYGEAYYLTEKGKRYAKSHSKES